MAVFYPTLDEIRNFKVSPTDGEKTLLNFLRDVLDDSFEVYFNPYLNGDRPDVIIMRKGYGVLIIEVKDWELSNFRLNERKRYCQQASAKLVNLFVELSDRCREAQFSSWSSIKFELNRLHLAVGDLSEVGAFREVLADEFVCIFDSSFLPRAVRISEIDFRFQGFGKFHMVVEFNTVVGGNGFESLCSAEGEKHLNDCFGNRAMMFGIQSFNQDVAI